MQRRFRDEQYVGLLGGMGWSLSHGASDLIKEEPFATVLAFFSAVIEGDRAAYDALLADKNFRQRMIGALMIKDEVARGSAALILGITGDRFYAPHLARLLEERSTSPATEEERFFRGYAKGRAAIALGILGATEYTGALVSLLGSSEKYVRGGAALGLGYMGAKGQAAAVAGLLSDRDMEVPGAAINALVKLEARQYAGAIARKMLDRWAYSDTVEIAAFALAKLGATEHAKDIAALLKREFHRDDAAKALALLGARQYTPGIARLLDDREDSVAREAAFIALGILRATEYAPRLARFLKRGDEDDRFMAAVALVLMEAPRYAREAAAIVERYSQGQSPFVYLREFYHPFIAKEYVQIQERLDDSLKKMKARP